MYFKFDEPDVRLALWVGARSAEQLPGWKDGIQKAIALLLPPAVALDIVTAPVCLTRVHGPESSRKPSVVSVGHSLSPPLGRFFC